MKVKSCASGKEPAIAVGLVQNLKTAAFWLEADYVDSNDKVFPKGEYKVELGAKLKVTGAVSVEVSELSLTPKEASHFQIEAVIGVDFHWEQKERQSFSGGLRLKPDDHGSFTIINDVLLEGYLTSVICSEMSANAHQEFSKAHAVISRSWLLAQVDQSIASEKVPPVSKEKIIRWYDREAHTDFDVCADDHCQRYQGVTRISTPSVVKAIEATRGEVLAHDEKVCDARFYKCCGGVTEDFTSAWGESGVPYLVPVMDAENSKLPRRSLKDERNFKDFILNPPAVFCNCDDPSVLKKILPSYDQKTEDFFRWEELIEAETATKLIKEKLGLDLGRILELEPIERAVSGRLVRLKITGEKGSIEVGKELEIRRVLSKSHLYSSAFYIEPQGPSDAPTGFLLKGSGWGHGVGLCQIGAAVMAETGRKYRSILAHYYPESVLEKIY